MYFLFLAQLSQQQGCLYNQYVVTKSYMLQAVNEHDTYHTPCKWDKCMADQLSSHVSPTPELKVRIRVGVTLGDVPPPPLPPQIFVHFLIKATLGTEWGTPPSPA